ncbi:hypothetical protein GCM10027091_38260 [Streptomyces daliensis]
MPTYSMMFAPLSASRPRMRFVTRFRQLRMDFDILVSSDGQYRQALRAFRRGTGR